MEEAPRSDKGTTITTAGTEQRREANEKRATSIHQNIHERGKFDISIKRSQEGANNIWEFSAKHLEPPVCGIMHYLGSLVRDENALHILCNYRY
jgi:hypothetical protein